MNINELTIGQAKELSEMFGGSQTSSSNDHPFEVGQKWLFRTVTHFSLGEIVAIYGNGTRLHLELKNASWVANTGRWHLCVANGIEGLDKAEVEPYPDNARVFVNAETLVDFVSWNHSLPRSPQG